MKTRLFWLFFAVLLLFGTYAWYASSFFPGSSNALLLRQASNLLAVLGMIFIFTQFLLSSRIRLIEVGFGLDRMLNYHRYFGRIGLGLIALHGVLYLGFQWFASGTVSFFFELWVGVLALLGFALTGALASIHKELKLAYEVWKNIHLLNYVLFPVALYHVFLNGSPGSLLYSLWFILAGAFTALIVYRIYRIYVMRTNSYAVVEVRQEAEDIWSLYMQGKKLSYKPGQFLMIQLLRKGRLSSSHPFTISSTPTRPHVAITPKNLGDFTATIKDTERGDKAFIDAPYGVFSFLNYPADELVFIAGGIGITPFMSMLRYMQDTSLKKKVTLFWANKHEKNLCFQDELETMQKEMHDFNAVLVMSGQKDWPGEQGRINAALLQKYLANMQEKEFFVCGPPAMSNATVQELKKLKVPGSRIHRELFEL